MACRSEQMSTVHSQPCHQKNGNGNGLYLSRVPKYMQNFMRSPSIHTQHNTIRHAETGRQEWAFKVGGAERRSNATHARRRFCYILEAFVVDQLEPAILCCCPAVLIPREGHIMSAVFHFLSLSPFPHWLTESLFIPSSQWEERGRCVTEKSLRMVVHATVQ